MADTTTVCTIYTVQAFSQQLQFMDRELLAKESSKDPVISTTMPYVKEGWPHTINSDQIHKKLKLANSLSTENGCLLMGARTVIPDRLRGQVLELIHFSIQWMKHAASPLRGVVAPHQRRHRASMPDLHNLCGTPEQAHKAAKPPMDATREALEPMTCGPCH